jgi:hypothetical protein
MGEEKPPFESASLLSSTPNEPLRRGAACKGTSRHRQHHLRKLAGPSPDQEEGGWPGCYVTHEGDASSLPRRTSYVIFQGCCWEKSRALWRWERTPVARKAATKGRAEVLPVVQEGRNCEEG